MLNILVIVTDEERSWADLPGDLRLPGREALASSAVSFTNFHVAATPCSPSRAALWTGEHIPAHGVFCAPSVGCGLSPQRTPTLANLLLAAGYRTAFKGKWNASELHPGEDGTYIHALRPYGFDEYQEGPDVVGKPLEGFRVDGDTVQQAADLLRRWAADRDHARPWFLAVNFVNPHDVMWFDATGRQGEESALRALGYRMTQAPALSPYSEALGYPLMAASIAAPSDEPDVRKRYREVIDYRFGRIPAEDRTALERLQNFYFNCIRESDRHVAHLLEVLRTTGHAESTLVVFTSDHGELAGAHALLGKDANFYKECFRVPLLVRHPKYQSQARTCSSLASSVDLVPTLISLSGLKEPSVLAHAANLPGVDLTPCIKDPDSAGPRTASKRGLLMCYSSPSATSVRLCRRRYRKMGQALLEGQPARLQFPQDYVDPDGRTIGRAIYDGDYKFARWFAPGDYHVPVDWDTLVAHNDLELYDHRCDSDERENLAGSPELRIAHRDLILAMNSKLNALLQHEVGDDDGREFASVHSLDTGEGNAHESKSA